MSAERGERAIVCVLALTGRCDFQRWLCVFPTYEEGWTEVNPSSFGGLEEKEVGEKGDLSPSSQRQDVPL